MNGHESEQVLILLKELSVLKQLDGEYESCSKTKPDMHAHRQRQRRHRDITEEIKALADEKQNSSEGSRSSDPD